VAVVNVTVASLVAVPPEAASKLIVSRAYDPPVTSLVNVPASKLALADPVNNPK
jgi:hypothetical protein